MAIGNFSLGKLINYIKKFGGGKITTQDEGNVIDTDVTKLNFVGASVEVADAGSGVSTITIDADAGYNHWVLEDGDGTEVNITNQKEVKFVENGGIDINWDGGDGSDGTPYLMDFEATYDNINALTTVTIASGDYLIVQDVNDSNNPKKGLVSDIGTDAGGSDTQIQYNNGGTAFGGIADLTWDDTDLTIGGSSATTKLKFRDSGLYINSSANGQLDIDADTTLEITAPTTTVAASTAINLNSDAISLGENGDTDVVVTFNANSADGVLTWMEDEDYFKFSDDILIDGTEKIQFYDSAIFINSSADGTLDVEADSTINVGTDNSGVAINIGHTTSEVTVGDNLTVKGDLHVSGSVTTIASTIIEVKDKNIVLGVVEGATDVTADGGGITLSGSTDKTFNWVNSTDAWTSSEHLTIGVGTDGTDYKLTFDGHAGDGVLTWMEDEDYFKFSDDILMNGTEKLMLGAAEEYMYGDGTDIHFGVGSGGDINIPADIGVTFGHATGDKIEGDGSSMTITSQEFTVDSAGDIILDTAGGAIFFKNGSSTQKGVLYYTAFNGFTLSSSIPTDDLRLMSGKDIVFDADDGGISFKDNGTEQLAIDMAGTVGQIDIQLKVDSDDLVFKQFDGNEVIRIADDRRLYFYDQGGEYISSDGTDLSIAAGTAINILAGIIDSSNQAVAWTPATSETAINIASGQFNVDTDNKRIGIGTTTVETPLHVQSASAPQVRMGYDATHFADFSMNNTHDLTIKPSSTGQVILQPTTDTTDFFQVLDANGGTSILQVDATNEMVGVGIDPPLVALDVHYKQAAPTSLANDKGGGEVVYFGGGTTTAGKLYYLAANGNWTATDADAVGSGAESMLAIALGTAPGTHGMLIRGWFDAHSYLSNFESGMAVFVSTTAGQMDTTSPSGCGDYVRIVGHCTNTANAIYFNPSAVWVEIATS